MLSGYSLVGRPPFNSMKALWRMKPEMIDFPGLCDGANALEPLLLRWYVTSIEPATSCLVLRELEWE